MNWSLRKRSTFTSCICVFHERRSNKSSIVLFENDCSSADSTLVAGNPTIGLSTGTSK
jgi:hypothetical protein